MIGANFGVTLDDYVFSGIPVSVVKRYDFVKTEKVN